MHRAAQWCSGKCCHIIALCLYILPISCRFLFRFCVSFHFLKPCLLVNYTKLHSKLLPVLCLVFMVGQAPMSN